LAPGARGGRVNLWAGGEAATVALVAAAVKGGFGDLKLVDLPRSFLPPHEPPRPLSAHAHGILKAGDVADLLSLAGTTRLEVVWVR
ncbi:MAG TPA: hypothetical protein P5137_17830, partial [Candidatus Brocadiia bacterium]|nr:hypothetical protein [Candidatus Brocadiia bacterium]